MPINRVGALLPHSTFTHEDFIPTLDMVFVSCHHVSIDLSYRPSCFRFPRGSGIGVDLASEGVAPDFKGTPVPVRPSLMLV